MSRYEYTHERLTRLIKQADQVNTDESRKYASAYRKRLSDLTHKRGG